MRILDRYVLQNFLVPFIYCFVGFIAIWLVFDLSDNAGDFLEAKVSIGKILVFYATQVPQITVMSMPIGLLLALLYSLSKMSRANEVISMLTAGRSVTRILMPLMAAGLLAALFCLMLNYELAPHAEGAKKALMDEIKGGKKRGSKEQLFRNRASDRTWYVKKMPTNVRSSQPILLADVYVVQQTKAGDIVEKFYAESATFYPAEKTWLLERGKSVKFDRDGNIESEDLWIEGSKRIPDWSETPLRIASSNLEPQFLSEPELSDYLTFNADFPRAQLAPYRTHWHYRWALPWACFIVVFIAAPLGIVYSRRGVLAGVASSIVIFFAMIFLNNFFLALGKGDRIPPFGAAWGPDILFGTVGAFLLYLRSNNREMPSLTSLFARKKH